MTFNLLGKKGLSELISIVLIIGLVIGIASFVMLWSTDLFESTSDEASLTAEKSLTCTNDVELIILDACVDSRINIFVENKKDRSIDGNFLLLKIEGDQDTILQPTPPGTNLLPFDKKMISITYFPELGNIRKVSIIPRIQTDKGYIFCTNNIAETSQITQGCNN